MNLLALVLVTLSMITGQQNAANGSISGTLKNASGVPQAGVRVSAMAVPGVDTLKDEGAALVSITQTDESGRYRLANIPPGRYYITAGLVTAPTFYPGVSEPGTTSIVTVSEEAALTGYDFRAINATGVTVKGRVISTGIPPGLSPTVILSGTAMVARAETSVAADGSFEFRRISPGTYQAVVTPPSLGVSTRVDFLVSNEDITDLKIEFAVQALIPVRVVKDDGGALPDVPWNVTARSNGPTSTVGGFGNLNLRLQDGSYQVSLNGVPIGYVVKSLTYGNTDISTTGLVEVETSKPGELVFTLAAVPAPGVKVSGKVVNIADVSGRKIRLTSILPNGPMIETIARADGSFEFATVPADIYRASVADIAQGKFPPVVVSNADVTDVTIDLKNLP
jgi:hypothetical protein